MIHRTLATATFALVAAALIHGCSDLTAETLKPIAKKTPGAVGDPCIPPDESHPSFPSFRLTEENMVDHFDACVSGICLVNHFQGRVSCPIGQAAPARCAGPNDTSCASGSCVAAGDASPFCDATAPDGGASACASGTCDGERSRCVCESDAHCPAGTACEDASGQCRVYVCSSGACQTASGTVAENEGKACCAEGSDTPVSAAVCGQCEAGSGRTAAEAVYCSCRCGLDDGQPDDGTPLCECPDGFECSLIRKNVALGDQSLPGKYCIRKGTAYTGPEQCGAVSGYLGDGACEGHAP